MRHGLCLSLPACRQVRDPFSVRVMVPCYKEDIETLNDTLTAAVKAAKLAMDANMANAGQLKCSHPHNERACLRLAARSLHMDHLSKRGCNRSTVTACSLGPHKVYFAMQARGLAAADLLVQGMLHHAGRKRSSFCAPVMHTAMHHHVPCDVCGLQAGTWPSALRPSRACLLTACRNLATCLPGCPQAGHCTDYCPPNSCPLSDCSSRLPV